MSKRIIVNLATFLFLFVALMVWAVQSIISFDFIERPYTVSAEFTTSPGLRSGFEVSYLGLRIGGIRSVSLEGDRVVAVLEIDRGTEIPADLTATVRRKSAVGEPYVDLTPVDNTADPDDVPKLQAGAVIPLERTSTPLAYNDLFAAFDRLVSAVPADDLRTIVHELAVGLEGRAGSIRTILTSAADLTTSLAGEVDLLDSLTTELTRITHTLAEKREPFGATVDNLVLFTETIAANRANISTLLGQGFTQQVATLLDASESDLSCIVTALGTIATRLSDPAHLDEIRELLQLAPAARDLLIDVRVEPGEDGADGLFLDGTISFTTELNLPPKTTPNVLPTPPVVPACLVPNTPAPGAGPASGSGAGGSASPSAGDSGVEAEPRRPAIEEFPASSRKEVGDNLVDKIKDLLPTLLLIGAIGALVALLVVSKPWRFLAGRGKGGDGGPSGPAPVHPDVQAEVLELERAGSADQTPTP